TPPSLLSIRPISVLLINTWVLSKKSQSIWYPVVTSSPLETQFPPGFFLVYTCCHVLPPLDVLTVLPKSVAKQISGFNGDIPMEKGFSPHVGPKRSLIQPPSKFAEGILPSFLIISFHGSVHVFPKSSLFATPIKVVSLFVFKL